MIFKKLIPSLLVGISLFYSTNSFSAPIIDFDDFKTVYQENSQDFISQYDNVLNVMLSSYKEKVKEPISARIFDIDKPLYYDFLTKSSHREYKDHFLAMRFYKNFRINNQPTSFCFILYDNKKSNELNQYLNFIFSNYDDLINYLSAHELGHCIASHQRVLGNIQEEPDRNKEEQIADMFAMAFFMSKGQNDKALSIIKLTKNTDAIHSNSAPLEKFYKLYSENSPQIKNIADLFDISYQYYLQIAQ